MTKGDKQKKVEEYEKPIEIGQGWSWLPIKDYYTLNNGEFCVTRDVVEKAMKDWGRKIEKVHIIAVLQKLYRLYFGL